jgi:hypothetical protein
LTNLFLHSWPNRSPPKLSLRTLDERQRLHLRRSGKGQKPLLRRYVSFRLTLVCLIIVLMSLQPGDTDGNAMAGPSTPETSTAGSSQQPQAPAPAAKSVRAPKFHSSLCCDFPAYRKNPIQYICFTRILGTMMRWARNMRALNITNVVGGIERL